MIDIKDISNANRFSTQVNEGAIYKYTLMKEEYILLKFSVDNPIYFLLGDYADLNEGLFEIVDLVFPTYNKLTGGYDYDLRMDAHYWKWKHKKLFYDRQKGKEAKWSLTRTPDTHMSIVVSNIAALGYTYKGKPYVFSMDATVKMDAIFIQYDNTNIIDAISMIAEACDCEWWVKENYIFLGHCEDTINEAITLEIGNELSDMTRSDSTSTYATRIISFGSERNIPKNYRPNSEDVVIEGVVQKRLKLPEGIPYIDAYPDMTTEEAVENVVFFDTVYPRRINTISEVSETRGNVVDDNDKPTGETYPIFTIKDTSLKDFKEEYLLDELRLVFQSGSLNGLHFALELKSSNNTGTTFEILRNQDYGQFLPNDSMKPEKDVTYILYGYDTSFVSDTLVGEAEQELLEETKKYVEKSKIDPSVYNCPTNPVRCAGYIENKYNKKDEIDLEAGRRVKLINPAFFQDGRQSRIYGFEKKLNNLFECTYIVGESTQYSRIGDVEDRLNALKHNGNTYINVGGGSGNIYVIKTNDPTIPTDQNVYSALMTDKLIKKQNDHNEDKYIRKDKPDETDYRVDLRDGITTGHYVEGFLGDGAIIDKDGNAEMTSLKLREFLEVPELRFNRIDVVSGELWNAVAFGLIEEVDEVNQIVKLKLEEGELSGMHLSDFCRGIFHNLTDNETAPGVDGSGFDVMVGFRTSYFTPVEIIDNASFKYELKPGSTVHPCKSMKFAVYGNPVDKNRQASAYHTRTYTRYLRGVNTWKIEAKHISMQLGDLSNLIINGESLAEGSVYLNNVYFGGNVWYTPEQKEDMKGNDAYSVTLSTYSAVYNIADGIYEQADVVSGENKVVTGASQVVASQFNVSTRLQVSKGPEQLRFSDIIGSGKYIVTSSGTNCKYVITDGLVAVQEVTEDKAEIKIEVNCEGIAVYEVVFTIVRVADGRDGKDYEYIYTRTTTEMKPATPGTSQTDDFVPNGWTDDSAGPTLELPFEWVCKRVKRDGVWRDYSIPSLWARFGEDGTDYEYIYIRTVAQSRPSTPATSQNNDYVPSGWTDDPVGPTSGYPYEWISKRAKVDSVWGVFSTPALWSKFAEDGTDHEFIYRRTTTYSTPSTPATSQSDDYVPSGWTDDPVGVTSTYVYEWMSKRDKVKGTWGSFSTPSLWAKYSFDGNPGADGRSEYTVYRRSASQPSTPSGSTIPPSGWSLDPPSGSTPLWGSKAIFNENGSLYRNWSYPVKISGEPGAPGSIGPATTYRGVYSSLKQYSGSPERVDVVKEGSYWYMAKTTAGVFSGRPPAVDNQYWKRLQGQYESIATGLLIADQANISGWRFRENYIESQNSNVVLDGNANDGPKIALGASYANRGNAPTRLYDDGRIDTKKLIARDGCDIGNFRVTTGKLSNVPNSFAMMQMTKTHMEVSLGTDLVPATAGGAFTLLGRIKNTIPSSSEYYKNENIALELSADSSNINTALSCPLGDIRINRGNLILNERYCPTTTPYANSIYDNFKNYRRFVFQPSSYQRVVLPSRAQIESVVGVWDAGYATAIEIKILISRWASDSISLQGNDKAYLINGDGNVHSENGNTGNSYGNMNMSKGDSCTVCYCNEAWYITELDR